MAGKGGMRRGKDGLFESLRAQEAAATEVLSGWINSLERENGVEALFEFETWLRGLSSFFQWRHLPLSEIERSALLQRSFSLEIRLARQALEECERCALALYRISQEAASPETDARAAGPVSKPGSGDFHPGWIPEQAAPAESLAQLLDCLNDLAVLMASAQDVSSQNLDFFLVVGRTLQRDIRNSRFVALLLNQPLRLHHDRVDNPVLRGIVQAIPEERMRRNVALALLHLYRLQRYLALIAKAIGADCPLRRYLVVFSLLHEQTESLCEFLKSRFLKEKRSTPELRDAAEFVMHRLRAESRRVSERDLAFVAAEKDPSLVSLVVGRSHGLLLHCYQGCVAALVHAFDPGMPAKTLFPSISEEQERGLLIQQNLWELRQGLRLELEKTAAFDLDLVLDRIMSFREQSMRHLMYQDWDELERFCETLITAGNQADVQLGIRNLIGHLESLIEDVAGRSVVAREAVRASHLQQMRA